MKTADHTILITGGGSGIGFAIAKLFSEKDNHVIITGRNKDKLQKAVSTLKNVDSIICDVTNEYEVSKLVETVKQAYPNLSILINNAGTAHMYDLSATAESFDKASMEMNTNYLAATRLVDRLLPVLKLQKEAAIINVSSIVAFVPSSKVPTYSASKAALHAYTQLLRHSLHKSSTIKIFELMPPLVNTEFSKLIGGENGISPIEVAQNLVDAMEQDIYEIQVGNTANIFRLLSASPAQAFLAVNPQ